TQWPALFSCAAAASPAGPDPTTAIRLPVRVLGGFGLIYPSSYAFSAIVFSMNSIVTGLLLMLNTQLASHGAGHMRPVNSGKLFVVLRMRIASSHLPRYTASLKSGMTLPSGQPL